MHKKQYKILQQTVLFRRIFLYRNERIDLIDTKSRDQKLEICAKPPI